MEIDLIDLNDKIKINFVPTANIFSVLFFLQGYYDLEKMCIALGGGEHKNNNNPYKLVNELCREKINAINYDDKKQIYTFVVQIPKQRVKEVTELGLFYQDPEDTQKEILIAYAQQDQPFFRNEICLELLLPHYPVYREEAIGDEEQEPVVAEGEGESEENSSGNLEEQNQMPGAENISLYASSSSSDENPEWEEKNINLEESPKLFNTDADLSIIWNLTSDQALTIEHTWNVQVHKKLVSELEYIPLATKFDKESNQIYLMYKERKIVNATSETFLYLQLYSLKKNVLKDFIIFYKLPAKTHDKGIFTALNAKGFRFYISYPHGVFCVEFKAANKETAQKSVRKHHNQFHPAPVGGNSTLFDLEGNVGLAGGTIGGLTHGRGLASTGLTRESFICLGPSDYIDKGVDDPITDYIGDPDEIKVIGDKDPVSKEKKGKELKLELEIEMDETELEIETSAVNTLKLNGTRLRANNFAYLSELSPAKLPRKPLKCFDRYAAKEFPRINALNYIHCKIERELFLFHKEIFKNRERRVYFVFNVQDNTIKSYKLPDDVRDAIKDNYMDSYDYIQVAATSKKLIYFFLTRNPMLEQTLGTQVICLNIAHKCPIVE